MYIERGELNSTWGSEAGATVLRTGAGADLRTGVAPDNLEVRVRTDLLVRETCRGRRTLLAATRRDLGMRAWERFIGVDVGERG
jgi:hypothetical protein